MHESVRSLLTAVSILVILSCLTCTDGDLYPVGDDTTDAGDCLSIKLVEYTNHGCIGYRSYWSCGDTAYLNDFKVAGDTLTLDLVFAAADCRTLEVVSTCENDTLTITAIDEINDCDHNCALNYRLCYLYEGSGELPVSFRARTRFSTHFLCGSAFVDVVSLP